MDDKNEKKNAKRCISIGSMICNKIYFRISYGLTVIKQNMSIFFQFPYKFSNMMTSFLIPCRKSREVAK
jgi:hypothetical protein